jgi:hypothetical protein
MDTTELAGSPSTRIFNFAGHAAPDSRLPESGQSGQNLVNQNVPDGRSAAEIFIDADEIFRLTPGRAAGLPKPVGSLWMSLK